MENYSMGRMVGCSILCRILMTTGQKRPSSCERVPICGSEVFPPLTGTGLSSVIEEVKPARKIIKQYIIHTHR